MSEMLAAGGGFIVGVATTIGALVIVATAIWKDLRG